jgi:NAD(P)-dependent dehydrogenase (short-subunit alcohol dehydrogenase family)
MKLENSNVFVTGASRGLGLALAREALARGAAKVYAGVRNPETFREPGITPVRIDVTNPASVAAASKVASDVTLLINNAGIAELTENPLAESVDSQSRRLFETNYYGVIRTTQAFAPQLPTDGSGGIVNVLSDATWKVASAIAPYAASKAALWSYTNNLRDHLKSRKIQVLGLHVGFMDTDLTKDFDVPKSRPEEVARETLNALEAGKSEVMADAGTRELKKALSADIAPYIELGTRS